MHLPMHLSTEALLVENVNMTLDNPREGVMFTL
jgi:hypothetical protein